MSLRVVVWHEANAREVHVSGFQPNLSAVPSGQQFKSKLKENPIDHICVLGSGLELA